MGNAQPDVACVAGSASAITVSVFSPRKSNLTSPTFSTQRMSNWVTTSPERGSR